MPVESGIQLTTVRPWERMPPSAVWLGCVLLVGRPFSLADVVSVSQLWSCLEALGYTSHHLKSRQGRKKV